MPVKNYSQTIFVIILFFSAQIVDGKTVFTPQETIKAANDTLKGAALSVKDTLAQKPKKEVLIPLKWLPVLETHSKNTLLSKETLGEIDYRTTSDFITNIPFGFFRDLGYLGQPGESLIYGNGYGKISFMSDGIPINNRLSNTLDLNLFQSESIDSVEIVPLTRGFLFGNYSNPVSLNFISRMPDSRKPFSRLRYYQASNGEGLMDAIFNIAPSSKLHAYLEVSNQSINPNYLNTDYSNWSGTSRLRYLLSNELNLEASYRYVKSVTELNGGVNAASIRASYPASEFDTILYDNFKAPVISSDRYQKVMINDFRLSALTNYSGLLRSDLSFYFQSTLTEFRQNEDSSLAQADESTIFHNNYHRTIGINLHQNINFGFGNVKSVTNLEKSVFNSPLLAEQAVKSSFSESVIATLDLFGSSFIPSVYGRYLNYSDKSYAGIGADAQLYLNSSFKLYGGYSTFQRPYSVWEERFSIPGLTLNNRTNSSAELLLIFRGKETDISLGVFRQSTSNALLSTSFKNNSGVSQTLFTPVIETMLNGMNLRIDFKLWKILFNTNTSFYFSSQSRKEYKLPDYTSTGGIYYIDTLFSSNLHLKTGLTYYSVGSREYINYDFERSITSFFNFDPSVPYTGGIINPSLSPTFQVDFFLAGRIQNLATIYFVFENLLGANYFIVPYFPKQSPGMRFGVSWDFLD